MTDLNRICTRIAAFYAEYHSQRVEIEKVENGTAEIYGHFGQTWTHGGWAEQNHLKVPVQSLQEVRARLEDGREVTPAEFRQLVAL